MNGPRPGPDERRARRRSPETLVSGPPPIP